MSTNQIRRKRRRSTNVNREQEAAEALARIQSGNSDANFDVIFAGFEAKGIPHDEILPRENVLTFTAWRAKGRTVKKGEHGVKLTTWAEYETGAIDPATSKPAIGRRPVSATVFHVSQTSAIGAPPDTESHGPASRVPADSGTTGTQNRPPAAYGAPASSQTGTPSATTGPHGATGPAGPYSSAPPAAERHPIAARLRTLADGMAAEIDRKVNPPIARQRQTRRRADIAASMRHDGYRLCEVRDALNEIADAIDAGTLPQCVWNFRKASGLTKKSVGHMLHGYQPTLDEEATRKWLADEADPAEAAEQERLEKIAKAERDLIGAQIEGFFPTPASLARAMVKIAHIQPGDGVLDPSAGKGDIADAVKEQHPDNPLLLVERNYTLAEVLGLKGYDVHRADIMKVQGEVDRIIMNPPYERGQDAEHVRHCFDLLKRGGRLVALMSVGPFHREDRKSVEFRRWLESPAVKIFMDEELKDAFNGAQSFRQTSVVVRLIVLDKPEA